MNGFSVVKLGWACIVWSVVLSGVVVWMLLIVVHDLAKGQPFLQKYTDSQQNNSTLDPGMAITLEYEMMTTRTQGIQVAFGFVTGLVFLAMALLLFAAGAVSAVRLPGMSGNSGLSLSTTAPGLVPTIIGGILIGLAVYKDIRRTCPASMEHSAPRVTSEPVRPQGAGEGLVTDATDTGKRKRPQVPALDQHTTLKSIILDVSRDQLPPDTGFDTMTFPQIVENLKELPGKALKVSFAAGDSFGSKSGAAMDWKQFKFFRFDAYNPSRKPVALALNVNHAGTSSFQTRVVLPIRLAPGKNEMRFRLGEMLNVNGTEPELAKVTKWFINDVENMAPTVFFSDFWLEESTVVADSVTQTSVQRKGNSARLARLRAAKMPPITKPIDLYTPEADAILSALEVFPPDNPWNLVIEDWPLHTNSQNIIASIGTDKPFRANDDMGFILVPPDQKKVDVRIGYPAESDRGPFPVPDDIPIEGWPSNYRRRPGGSQLTLDDVQRNRLKEEGDRHAIVVDPVKGLLYEFYQMRKTDSGWQAAQASIFDLQSNKMRPEGWTSTDAAGLPIFPSVVRYDELQRGQIDHPLRVTVRKSRRAYVYPARHYASSLTDPNLPRMGERIRLRKDFDISGFSPNVKAILEALKRYGMFVADNGIDWAISIAPDQRIPEMNAELRKVRGSDFEVVEPPADYRPPPAN